MKAVNVDDVLKILHKYGKYIFVTDEKKYSSMIDEIANLKSLDAIEIIDKYKAESEDKKMKVLVEMSKELYDSLSSSEGITWHEVESILTCVSEGKVLSKEDDRWVRADASNLPKDKEGEVKSNGM